MAAADVFQILADPTRRRIVEELKRGERSVGELVEVVEIGQPGVSRALAILEDAEFVTAYKAIWEPWLDRLGAELERRRKSKEKKEKKR